MVLNEEFSDGYSFGVRKLDGVSLDGYLAEVRTALGRYYTGRFATQSSALSWCRKMVVRDRRAPLPPN